MCPVSAHSDDQRESMKKKRMPFSSHPVPGFTGSQVAKLAGTPNSSNSPSLNQQRRKGSKGSISRPASTASPRSNDGNHTGNANATRASRYPSLDDRLSLRDSLPDSRVQSSDERSPMSQNGENGQLVMAEANHATNNTLSPPKNERVDQILTKSFVPPRSSPLSTGIPSPRHRHARKVERGIQSKPTSTTREVQTGVFTKTAQTMTAVVTKDAQTQKKLRKPKVSHFTHQFNGLKRSQAIQVDRIQTTHVACQWEEHQSNVAVKKTKVLAKNYEFRQAVTQFRQCDTGRMADSILRRLHDHQKQGQLCDLTILIGDEEPIRCHKHIVAMVSDVIQVEAMEKEEIYLANIAKDTLTQLIDYCYTAMIGPFVSKEQIEAVCDGVKKLKIRQLDMVVEKLQTGLATGQDYFHSAISGTELISSDIITAAMMGQAIPPTLQSSAGLIDLFDENGFEMPQDTELTLDEEPSEIELDLKAQVKSLPFKKRIVQHDTPSDTDSDSVEPPTIQLRSPPPTPTANTVVVKTPRPVGRPPKNANGPKSTPQPTGRPRGRPRLSESSSGAKNTPKLPKKRNLSEQNDAENSPKVARKSRRSLKSAEIVPDSPVSVLDSLSEAEVANTVTTTTPSTKKKSRSASPKVFLHKKSIETPKREPKKEPQVVVAKKEPKTPKKPSTPAPLPKKRKSVLIPPTLTCPWKTDETVQQNMMLADRNQFCVNTGHRVQCTYLATLYKPGKEEASDDDDEE